MIEPAPTKIRVNVPMKLGDASAKRIQH